MPAHVYSPAWYATFLETIPPEQTAREVEFISRQMPATAFSRILDICCGTGRHANLLAQAGYRVLGIDTNDAALESARARAPKTATYRHRDMRHLDALDSPFDGALCLWASFGFFDDAANESMLRQIAGVLRPGGRAIIDVYNPDFMQKLPESETTERGGSRVETKRSWRGNRFRVELTYAKGGRDEFEWLLYAQGELSRLCHVAGLQTILVCASFDEAVPASAGQARMQFVLERRNT